MGRLLPRRSGYVAEPKHEPPIICATAAIDPMCCLGHAVGSSRRCSPHPPRPWEGRREMAALTADTEAAAGGGRVVEKGSTSQRCSAATAVARSLTHSGCSRLLGQRRRGGLLAKSCGGLPHGRARCQPFASGTAAHFIKAALLARLAYLQYFRRVSCSTTPASVRHSTCSQLLSTAWDSPLFSWFRLILL